MDSNATITGLLIMNGAINFVILMLVAPLFNLKGKVCMIRQSIESFENRILSLEERQ